MKEVQKVFAIEKDSEKIQPKIILTYSIPTYKSEEEKKIIFNDELILKLNPDNYANEAYSNEKYKSELKEISLYDHHFIQAFKYKVQSFTLDNIKKYSKDLKLNPSK